MSLHLFQGVVLRYTQWWLAIGIILIVALIIASLMPVPTVMTTFPAHTDKLEHLVAYFVLMGWFVQIYHLPAQRLRLALFFIILGLLLEVLQGVSGIRQADWADMVANSLGVLLAWQIGKTQFSYLFFHIEEYLK